MTISTPLIAACRQGNVEIINLLVAKEGIDINLHDNASRMTPIMVAALMGFVEVVVSPRERWRRHQHYRFHRGSCLGVFASLRHVDIVKLLLSRPDIDPNFVAGGGQTALMLACADQEPDVVKLLLDQEKIDVNRQDDNGRTALCKAAYYGCLESATLLLERKDTDINISDNDGRTALFRAIYLFFK